MAVRALITPMRMMTTLLAIAVLATGTTARPVGARQPVRPTGLVFLDESTYRSIPLASSALMGANVPSSVDLSSFFPSPGDQGAQASCVGWAVAYALKGYQEARERNWSADTPDRQFSAAYIYNQIKPAGCDGGSTFVEALNLLRSQGVATMSTFPYVEHDCARMPSESVRQSARPYAIADWRRVNVQDEVEVKGHLASGFPVLFGMAVDTSFSQLRPGQVYDQGSGQSLGGHAMVVAGYDDARGAFLVVNSWGKSWGDDGRGWVSYRAFRRAVREGYVVQDIIVQPPAPQPPSPSPAPGPVPAPDPAPSPPAPVAIPTAHLGSPAIRHNVPVIAPNGGTFLGMAISVPGALAHAAGRTVQVVVRFSLQNGAPLMANPAEAVYRDVRGLAATGTPQLPVPTTSYDLSGLTMFIPYYALNLQGSGGTTTYNLTASASVYVDGFHMGQSPAVPFLLRW